MRYLLFFLTALIVSYASEWGPHYVSLFAGGRLAVVGTLHGHEEPCHDSPHGNVICKVIYRIPRSYISAVPDAKAVGIGVLLHATEIGCASNFKPLVKFGEVDTAGRTLDFLNVYQTFNLANVPCSNDLLVKTWSPASYRRYGHIDAPIVVGDMPHVERVKRFIEFFRSQLLTVVATLFLSVFVFNRILVALMNSASGGSMLEPFAEYWVGFSLIFSGIANTLIPIISESFLFTRLSNFVTLMAHFGPGILGVSEAKNTPRALMYPVRLLMSPLNGKARIRFLHLFAFAYVLSPYFAIGLAPLFLCFSILFLSGGLISQSSLLTFFGLASFLDSLKLFMVPHLPTSYLTMVFTLLCLSDLFLARVRKAASLIMALRWTRDQIEQFDHTMTAGSVLRRFAERFQVGQISLIVPKKHGGCEILLQRRNDSGWTSEQLYRNGLPPIFSHVLTTREPLWHIEEDSLFALNLRKGEPRTQAYKGQYFSVIPLIKDSIPVGSVGITDYSSQFARDEFYKLELQSVANLLFPFLSGQIAHQSASEREDWADLCNSLATKINNIGTGNSSAPSDEALLQKIALITAEGLGAGVFVGRLEHSTRKIRIEALAGHSREVEELYREVQFYAVAHNEQGPLPLAINRGRPVTVSDVTWIRSVLHPITIKIFDKSQIRSCAAVPLFDPGSSTIASEDQSRDIWGVLWVESSKPGAFLPQTESGLTIIANAIENALSHYRLLDVHNRAKEALAGFVPSNVLSGLLEGKSVRQTEQGYLLMADLRDSTRISRRIGAEEWNGFTQALSLPAEAIGKKYGYSLQCIVWDAFYFTKPALNTGAVVDDAVNLARDLNSLFEFAYQAAFGESPSSDSQTRARFCLVHGDTTRDLKEGITNNWTIVGTAMASVSKLEQACKGLRGWFFASEGAISKWSAVEWENMDTKVAGTDEAVFRIRKGHHVAQIDKRMLALFEKGRSSKAA